PTRLPVTSVKPPPPTARLSCGAEPVILSRQVARTRALSEFDDSVDHPRCSPAAEAGFCLPSSAGKRCGRRRRLVTSRAGVQDAKPSPGLRTGLPAMFQLPAAGVSMPQLRRVQRLQWSMRVPAGVRRR
ncbi:MAG: hypothetical protein BJ554DRAFT_5251, partial [Olpidium bornovanus]